ncbi:MAG TPA: protein kinase [Planctomycetota bacterium]|nr:protein kinase [Planctomycetota bacterium]
MQTTIIGEGSMSGEIAGFLKGLGPFSSLTPNALTGIARLVRLKHFQPGERIIARGEPGDAMYIIQSGEVRIPILDAHGNEKMVAKLSAGQFFGEMSLMTGDPRTADVFAVGRVTTLMIVKDVFYQLTREQPSLARFLTQILADRLSEGGLMASKTIGKYQLVDELGRGGMAVVFNAIHTSLRRAVAVKMLNHQLAFDEKFREQFQQEAFVIAGLNHENIVQVYDTEQAYATFFIVMEYVQGTGLDQLIDASGSLPEQQARDILIQMCRALGYAHQKGIVHRDVKPSNAIMTTDGRVKLMDFGIARVQRSEARPDDEEIVGTAEYMSPEQIQATGVDGRSDLYALGIMAYQMLSGTLPFVASNPYDVLLAHCTKPLPPIRERANVSPDLVEFIERATQKDPAQRFQSMAEAEAMISRAGGDSGAFSMGREGKCVTIFYPPSEAGAVDRALAQLRQTFAGNPNIRFGASTLQVP